MARKYDAAVVQNMEADRVALGVDSEQPEIKLITIIATRSLRRAGAQPTGDKREAKRMRRDKGKRQRQ